MDRVSILDAETIGPEVPGAGSKDQRGPRRLELSKLAVGRCANACDKRDVCKAQHGSGHGTRPQFFGRCCLCVSSLGKRSKIRSFELVIKTTSSLMQQ